MPVTTGRARSNMNQAEPVFCGPFRAFEALKDIVTAATALPGPPKAWSGMEAAENVDSGLL